MDSTHPISQRKGPVLRKSRSGCRDCRLRKVKCDEVKPVCSNCRRRYVSIQSCVWGSGAPRSDVHNSETPSLPELSEHVGVHVVSAYSSDAHISSLTLHPSSVTSSGQWRTIELRLIYHYTSVVSHLMPICDGASGSAWQQVIPQLSFESEVVLNPMLTLSALHLHTNSPTDATMALALRRYLDRTLVKHRLALANGEGLSEQIWLSAVILSHIYWLLVHQRQPDEPYELPLQAFKILRGIGIVFTQHKVFLRGLGYDWFGSEGVSPTTAEDELSIAAQVKLRSIEEDLAHLLDAFDVQAQPDEDRAIYIEAKDFVLYHYRAFYSGAVAKTFQRFIAIMAVRCQPGYWDMLQRHDPLAMALMARMLVLLRELDHAWWMNGEGDYEVVERDIQGICELVPPNLRWTMDWPCKVVDKEIILNLG